MVDIDKKSKELSALSASFFAAMVGAVFFYYSVVLQKIDSNADAAAAVSHWVQTETAATRKILADAKKRRSDFGIKSISDFLTNINEVSKQNNILMRSLTPVKAGSLAHKISFVADYYRFVGFAAALEARDVVINGVEVHPYDSGARPPTHVVTFTITPRNDARELQDERLSALVAEVGKKDKRNPFQRFAFGDGVVTREIDVTWLYKLSGISKINNEWVSTIDSQDYAVGQALDGMQIVKIDRNRVTLTKNVPPNGEQRYVLKFRN